MGCVYREIVNRLQFLFYWWITQILKGVKFLQLVNENSNFGFCTRVFWNDIYFRNWFNSMLSVSWLWSYTNVSHLCLSLLFWWVSGRLVAGAGGVVCMRTVIVLDGVNHYDWISELSVLPINNKPSSLLSCFLIHLNYQKIEAHTVNSILYKE